MAGLAAAFGSGAMTNTIADIEQADVILITGSNTTENHPVISSVVKRAVHSEGQAADRGRPAAHHDDALRAASGCGPTSGTDVAWINGLMHVIIAEDLHDQEFVRSSHRGLRSAPEDGCKHTPPSMWKRSPASRPRI